MTNKLYSLWQQQAAKQTATCLLTSLIACLLIVLPVSQTMAQKTVMEIELGREYYQRGEMEKAREVFAKVARNKSHIISIYPDYLQTLVALKDFKEAENYLERIIKAYPEESKYKLILINLYEQQDQKSDANKLFDKLLKQTRENAALTEMAALEATEAGFYDKAVAIYEARRKETKNRMLYAAELANLYNLQGEKEKATDELITMVEYDFTTRETAQNLLQNFLSTEDDFDMAAAKLLTKVQQDPDNVAMSEMLLWMYVQRKDFFGAFQQVKALDRRTKSQGKKLYDVAELAVNNKSYQQAIDIYTYIVDNYPRSPIIFIVKKRLVNAREKQLRESYPVTDTQVLSLNKRL